MSVVLTFNLEGYNENYNINTKKSFTSEDLCSPYNSTSKISYFHIPVGGLHFLKLWALWLRWHFRQEFWFIVLTIIWNQLNFLENGPQLSVFYFKRKEHSWYFHNFNKKFKHIIFSFMYVQVRVTLLDNISDC